MSLKIGIVGLPNVGKSTLFNALTKKKVDIANYPFCTIEPNVGVVEVPDSRLSELSNFSRSKKTIPTVVEFVDVAGLVKGAAKGEGLGNKFLSHIKEVDAIAHVVRVFEDKDIIRVHEKPDPLSDIEIVEYELILKDLENVKKRLETSAQDPRAQKKGAEDDIRVLKIMESNLLEGRLAYWTPDLSNLEKENLENIMRELRPLTAKPIIYIFNASELQIKENWQPSQSIRERIGTSQLIIISAKIESEIAELPENERVEYLSTFGLKKSGLNALIQAGYKALGLITFFTTGEDETRAWTIPQNSRAPRAGRAIHSDFETKFIRAEVIEWQKLIEAGSVARARELGWIRTEGKEYIVKDGDIIEFKI